LTKQETIAGIRNGRRIVAGRRVLQLTENADIATIVDLVQKRAVAARCDGRTQHKEIGAEFDEPARIARRELKIGDRLIGGGVRIEREEGATAQLLVGAGGAEFGTRREWLAAQDFDALDPRGGRRCEPSRCQEQPCDDATAHD
jgi:hypothetical protein